MSAAVDRELMGQSIQSVGRSTDAGNQLSQIVPVQFTRTPSRYIASIANLYIKNAYWTRVTLRCDDYDACCGAIAEGAFFFHTNALSIQRVKDHDQPFDRSSYLLCCCLAHKVNQEGQLPN